MTKRTSKIKYSNFAESINKFNNDNLYKEVEIDGIVIKYKLFLQPEEVEAVINFAVEQCYGEGKYRPGFKNIAIETGLISLCTNIEMPKQMDKLVDLLRKTNISRTLLENMDHNILKDIYQEVDKILDAKIKYEYSSSCKIDEFVSMVTIFISQFGNLLESAEIESLLNELGKLSQQNGDKNKYPVM